MKQSLCLESDNVYFIVPTTHCDKHTTGRKLCQAKKTPEKEKSLQAFRNNLKNLPLRYASQSNRSPAILLIVNPAKPKHQLQLLTTITYHRLPITIYTVNQE